MPRQHGVACSIGSNLEWDIATAAMGHLVVGTPNMQVEKYPGDMLGPELSRVLHREQPAPHRGAGDRVRTAPAWESKWIGVSSSAIRLAEAVMASSAILHGLTVPIGMHGFSELRGQRARQWVRHAVLLEVSRIFEPECVGHAIEEREHRAM